MCNRGDIPEPRAHSDTRTPLVRCAATGDDVARLIGGMLALLKPWPATEQMSPLGWVGHLSVANFLQHLDSNLVAGTIGAFHDCRPATYTSLFLLPRVVFELPERIAMEEFPQFAFLCAPLGAPWEYPDGVTINAAWPISWKGSMPELIAGCSPMFGDHYDPESEYRFLKNRFPYRDLREPLQALVESARRRSLWY